MKIKVVLNKSGHQGAVLEYEGEKITVNRQYDDMRKPIIWTIQIDRVRFQFLNEDIVFIRYDDIEAELEPNA